MILDPVKLAQWGSGRWCSAKPRRPVTGFAIDTRKLKPNQVFVALCTGKRDGHDFLSDAKNLGASAALVERFNPSVDISQLVVEDTTRGLMDIARGHRREFVGEVIGITGSCGKTSTKDALALLLGDSITCKTQANLNNRLGLSLTLLELNPTIHSFAVVEAGISEPGEMKDLAQTLEPDSAILTLVGQAHVAGLGGLDDVAREKFELLREVRPDGFALFPEECLKYPDFLQDSIGSWILSRNDSVQLPQETLRYQLEREAGSGRARLHLRSNFFIKTTFTLPSSGVIGEGMVHNLAMALGVALRMGICSDVLQERLIRWEPSPLRGEVRIHGRQQFYVDCYNANPVSMRDAFSAFTGRFESEPKLFVLGCMDELGEDTVCLHRETGRDLNMGPWDRAIVHGKQAEALRDGLLDAGGKADSIAIVVSLEDARAEIETFEGAILLKGSRAYGLESLLPKDEAVEERGLAAC